MAHGLRTEYGAVGVLSVFGFHIFRRQYGALVVSQLGLFFFLYLRLFPQHNALTLLVSSAYTAFTIIPLLMIKGYDGQAGPRARYFFYVFYPGHLLALYGLQRLLLR